MARDQRDSQRHPETTRVLLDLLGQLSGGSLSTDVPSSPGSLLSTMAMETILYLIIKISIIFTIIIKPHSLQNEFLVKLCLFVEMFQLKSCGSELLILQWTIKHLNLIHHLHPTLS